MNKLYYYTLCPFSRKVRAVASILNVPFLLIEEKFWERRKTYLRLNPIGSVPLLVTDNGINIFNSYSICHFLLARYKSPSQIYLLPNLNVYNAEDREDEYAKILNICSWFDEKFSEEVSKPFLYEKVVNFFKTKTPPDVSYLTTARYNLGVHMEYLEFLLTQNEYLVGENMTLADVCAASHLSVVDYVNEIRWDKVPNTKMWYSIMKSKPYFKDILKERISGFPPPLHYDNPDF